MGVKRKRSPGWLPDQHGAWAMVTVPALTGVYLAGPQWLHLPLLALWWVGYFFFFAATLWLRSRRLTRHRAPVLVYGSATTILGLLVLWLGPGLLYWVPFFAPLLAVAGITALRRQERSLASRTATVLAATLMCLVTFDAGTGPAGRFPGFWMLSAPPVGTASVLGSLPLTGWPAVLLLTLVLSAYYWATIPHVRALVRGRNNPIWLATSVGFHLFTLAGVTWGATIQILSWWLVAVWLLLVIRALAFPLYSRRVAPLRPQTIGVAELVINALIVLALLS